MIAPIPFFRSGTMQEDVRSPHLKYPWQQAVLDAFIEFQPEKLPAKIAAAKLGISMRLSDPTLANDEERIALQDALNSLRVLEVANLTQRKEIA